MEIEVRKIELEENQRYVEINGKRRIETEHSDGTTTLSEPL